MKLRYFFGGYLATHAASFYAGRHRAFQGNTEYKNAEQYNQIKIEQNKEIRESLLFYTAISLLITELSTGPLNFMGFLFIAHAYQTSYQWGKYIGMLECEPKPRSITFGPINISEE